MSKRELKKYVSDLSKTQLEEQIIALYDKFSEVKTFYNFVFNPKEELLIKEAKIKIALEYYPIQNIKKKRKPKMRRSVAQKYIKHFSLLGVDDYLICDIMLYNIEIAQTFCDENPISQDLFYKSMHNSFQQAVKYAIEKGILSDFKVRFNAIYQEAIRQKWYNIPEFERAITCIT